MNSPSNQETTEQITRVLASAHRKGVRLWSENGQLRYKALKGALSPEEIQILRTSKSQIVTLLNTGANPQCLESGRDTRRGAARAPLTFSQLSHWNWFHLGERRHIRQITSVTRLCGRLDLDAFRRSVTEMVRRHEALRTRIVIQDGIPAQEVLESGACEVQLDDLTRLSEDRRQQEIDRLIESHILEPVDVTADPLFAVRLLRLSDEQHVLIFTMEHTVSDGFSRSVLLHDLLKAYLQAAKGRPFSLPEIPVQFADYAFWQKSTQRSWIEKHGAYWNEHLAGCQRVRFPADESLTTGGLSGWGGVPVHIGKELKAELLEWCRARGATLAMSVFVAYVAVMMRWCGVSDMVIRYQSDGRVSPKLAHAIGYFSFVLCLRIRMSGNDRWIDLLKRVTDEYCDAYEHTDFGYIEAQVPRPDFVRNSAFNWIPQGSAIDPSDLEGYEGEITCSPAPFEHPLLKILQWDREPFIQLFDREDEIVGRIHFPLNRFSVGTMERFRSDLLTFIESLLRDPEQRIRDVVLTQ